MHFLSLTIIDIIGVSLLQYFCVYINPLGLLPEVVKPILLFLFNLCCIILAGVSHNLYQNLILNVVHVASVVLACR